MENNLYEMIFKRKSFHLFRNIGNKHITDKEFFFNNYMFSTKTYKWVYNIFRKFWVWIFIIDNSKFI